MRLPRKGRWCREQTDEREELHFAELIQSRSRFFEHDAYYAGKTAHATKAPFL
jgi:hypothetical protein